jgi:hypothetical protein
MTPLRSEEDRDAIAMVGKEVKMVAVARVQMAA